MEDATANATDVSGMAAPRFCVITPAKNEARFLPELFSSMLAQSARPAEWVIVDDNSTDGTADLAEKMASGTPWIKVVRRTAPGEMARGGRVVRVFYDGVAALTTQDWRFIGKLDADVSFEKDYFERLFGMFEKEPTLGIGGGRIWSEKAGEFSPDDYNLHHVAGAVKMYRRECLDDMNEIYPLFGWDGIDETAANMHGWTVRTVDECPVFHHRPTGSAYGLRGLRQFGLAAWAAGSSPLFMFLRSAWRLKERPLFVRGAMMFAGYVQGWLCHTPRVPVKEVRAYRRRQEWRRMLFLERK